jgi:hypothetical protein
MNGISVKQIIYKTKLAKFIFEQHNRAQHNTSTKSMYGIHVKAH